MNEVFAAFKSVLIFIGATIAAYLGGWDALIRSLCFLIVLDFISGTICSFANKTFDSFLGWMGFAKKIGTFCIIAVAVVVDNLTGVSALRDVTLYCFIFNECTSLLENWGKMGLPLPKKLKNALTQLKDEAGE